MHEPTYREALTAAWHITWRHKFLWIFGIFAAFVGQFGLLDVITKMGFTGTDYAYFPLWAYGIEQFPLSALFSGSLGFNTWLLLIWIGVLLLGFGILFFLVSVASHGSLVHATAQFSRHPKKHIDIDTAWHAGITHFWKLSVIIIFKMIALFLLSVGVGYAIINAVQFGNTWDVVLFLVLFILSLVVGMGISFVAIYAAGYVVMEEYSSVEAILAAWTLFKEHWLVSIEIGITVLVINVVISIIAIASVYILLFPTLLLWLAASGAVFSEVLLDIGTFLAIGMFIVFIATLGSILTVFSTTLWMYLFEHMHRQGIRSNILKFFVRTK
jgi:hypothetical protein